VEKLLQLEAAIASHIPVCLRTYKHPIVTYEVWLIFVFDPWNQKRTQKHVSELAAAETGGKSLQ